MNDIILSFMLMGAVGGNNQLPYWMTTNQYGIYPQNTGAVAKLQLRQDYDESKTFQWRWGASLAANSDPDLIMDQFYAGVRWKVLSLDLGIRHRELDFLASDPNLGSLSVTGGHLVESGNSRSMPGYTLNLAPLSIPFTKDHLKIYGSFGDYRSIDNRYVEGAWVHRQRLFAELEFGKFQFHLGLDHYAVWNGVSPVYGQMPNTFADYWRVVFGLKGPSTGTLNDKMNVIGDHGGSELFKFVWKDDTWSLTFQHDIPYNDKSGMLFHNFPDGVNTLHFGFADKNRWVSDILYEFQYTRYQSGPIHDREVDEKGQPIPWRPGLNFTGLDNYFNNGEYRSGWTCYGRTIGNPLFFPVGTRDGSWDPKKVVLGIENNRLRSHHIGMSGKLFRRHPYKLMLTYSMNYGTYSKPYAGESAAGKPWGSVKEEGLWQFSAGFTGEITDLFRASGFNLCYGIYFDKGQVLKECAGATLGLRYTFSRRKN